MSLPNERVEMTCYFFRLERVCTLTARTQPERMEQRHEGASGQEEKQWS